MRPERKHCNSFANIILHKIKMQKGILCKTPFCLILNTKNGLTVMNYTNLTKILMVFLPCCKKYAIHRQFLISSQHRTIWRTACRIRRSSSDPAGLC